MPGSSDRDFLDVAIIVPLEEELRHVMDVFPSIRNMSDNLRFRHFVDVGDEGIKCLVAQQPEMGRTSATETASGILRDYDVNLLICIGIAGSLSEDLRLADVCYSGHIMDVLDNAKMSDSKSGSGVDPAFSPTCYETPRELTTVLNFIRTQPELRGLYEKWQTDCEADAARLVPNPVPGRNGVDFRLAKPQTMGGGIVCGAVSKSQQYNQGLVNLDRKLLAIETESGGIFPLARAYGKAALTIRGISDYADSSKTKLENASKGNVRALAARNAATFLRMQFKNTFFVNYLRERKQQGPLTFDSHVRPKTATQSARDVLIEVAADIDTHLKELCPEYKTQPQGYKLPIPRAKLRETAHEINKGRRSSEAEIRSIIAAQRVIMLDMPKSYPDQALPWMIAHDLLTAEISEAQVIPIYIDGSKIAPPNRNLSRVSGYDLDALSNTTGFAPVIIVDHCPLNSGTRMKFLFEEVEKHDRCRFVFISRGDGSLFLSFLPRLQFEVELFEICEISFLELMHFIECNFHLSTPDSEVIALKLQETFKRYDLSPYPSYFALISNSALVTLINANRRSELIQLAVDATLSFVVADDKSDLALSRTTRTRFLQRLVRAIRVDGQMFDEAGIIAYAAAFAQEFDFDIDALKFVTAFIDHGILHIENGYVEVSLPYVESYLLARELIGDPSAAKRYFNPQSDFDEPTFDTYAEMGPAVAVVEMVCNSLSQSLDAYAGINSSDEATLNIMARSGAALSTAKFTQLYTQMQEAINEVVSGRPASERKQQILDMRQAVRSKAADLADGGRGKSPSSGAVEDSQRLLSALKAWRVGLTLINRGAEHLTGEIKRSLAHQLIALGSKMLTDWNQKNKHIDFGTIRSVLTSDEFMDDFYKKYKIDMDKDQKVVLKKMMGSIIDFVEDRFLSRPVSTLLRGFGGAHQRVLGMSLSKVSTSSISERLFRALWMLELEPSLWEDEAKDAINQTPKSVLLRSTICNHLVATAYWNFSDKDAKKSLANVADQCIRPFSELVDRRVLDI